METKIWLIDGLSPQSFYILSQVALSNNKQVIIFKVRTDRTKIPYLYDGKAFLRSQSITMVMP